MNKKAISTAADMFWKLAFLVMIIIVFMTFVTRVKDNNLHALRVEAREYAFTRDAILSSQNSIAYNFKLKENISLSINPESCLVETKYIGDSIPIRFLCVKSTKTLLEQPNNNIIKIVKNE